MVDKPEPLVLPKKFAVCPHCGSSRRFCEEALKGDLSAEEMAEGMPILQSAELMVQPKGALFPIRLLAVMDACADCGTVYAVELMKFRGQPNLVQGNNGHPPR